MDSTDSTIRSYSNRLTPFVEWCEEEPVESVGELSGWLLDEYRRSLTEDAPVTVKGKMMAVKQLLGYLGRIDAVDTELEEKVPIPKLSAEDERSEIKLAPDDASSLLAYYRESKTWYGTPRHTLLEVLWFTGCRLSGIRALDFEDYDNERGILRFVNRPQTGTRLKNGKDGERPVAIPPEVVDVLDTYIHRERFDKRDEHGRRPLFSARQARPSKTTVRAWSYLGTQPCVYTGCPHGRERPKCNYRERNYSGSCPSSRSPHQVRTGSITWQLNCGMPIEDVAERVNSTPAVIRRHYDVATGDEKLEERRRDYLGDLSISDNE
ncbi:site-specific integrase [Halomicroarcula sp. S1AR25-4]|uniref:tyrosine-type recombinase/integrase n=1 Tax=Haloarcula sp. S1AR25-4 TaxID=2950538 RepID=UPI0028763E80|nr:tyrosine-type recombinase/integrase [Halomicroarcula sp. S1AR25-4]MDS0276456.1 site-specific integrase [Halomicroarcula sp. S1AR25-4]